MCCSLRVSRSHDQLNLIQNFMIIFPTNYKKTLICRFSGDFSHVTRPVGLKSDSFYC